MLWSFPTGQTGTGRLLARGGRTTRMAALTPAKAPDRNPVEPFSTRPFDQEMKITEGSIIISASMPNLTGTQP
jgi:hypothetical protein